MDPGQARRKACLRIGERMRARPTDSMKKPLRAFSACKADEPEPAIRSGAEYGVSAPQRSECRCDMPPTHRRRIGSDDDDRPNRGRPHSRLEPRPEIAAGLGDDTRFSRPKTAPGANRAPWFNGNDHIPARVDAFFERYPEQPSKDFSGAPHADRPPKSRLDAACFRSLRHDDQRTFHLRS